MVEEENNTVITRFTVAGLKDDHKLFSPSISLCTDLLCWTANQSDLCHFCFTILNPNSWCGVQKHTTGVRFWVLTDAHTHLQQFFCLLTSVLFAWTSTSPVCWSLFVILASRYWFYLDLLQKQKPLNWRSLMLMVWFLYLLPHMLQNRHSRQKKQARPAETCCFCDTVQMLLIWCANFCDIYT